MPVDRTTDIAIIGGGILGCAIACYLSREPGLSVAVFERHGLGEQTTSHAAALLTRARPDPAIGRMVAETFDAIDQLSAELEDALPLRAVGSLHVAQNDESLTQLKATQTQARRFGDESEWLRPSEAQTLAPWLNLTSDTQTLWMPRDGYIDPYQLCTAYAAVARHRGVRFNLNTSVTDLCQEGRRVTGLTVEGNESLSAGLVIDAAGPWSTALARQVGVHLAMGAIRSHYWITAKDPRVIANGPLTILPDSHSYARPEVGGLLFGLRDPQAVYADPAGLPDHLAGFAFDSDSDGQEALMAGYPALQAQCPLIAEVPLAHYVSNISSYTPDAKPLLGAMPGVDGFVAATGCSGGGIGLSGGIGRFIADLALDRRPFVDTAPFELDRFGAIDPYTFDFQRRCALARSAKRTG